MKSNLMFKCCASEVVHKLGHCTAMIFSEGQHASKTYWEECMLVNSLHLGRNKSAHEWVFALAGGHANCAQEKSGAMQTLTGGD